GAAAPSARIPAASSTSKLRLAVPVTGRAHRQTFVIPSYARVVPACAGARARARPGRVGLETRPPPGPGGGWRPQNRLERLSPGAYGGTRHRPGPAQAPVQARPSPAPQFL